MTQRRLFGPVRQGFAVKMKKKKQEEIAPSKRLAAKHIRRFRHARKRLGVNTKKEEKKNKEGTNLSKRLPA